MNFLKKLFVRRPEDYLEKGDALLASGSMYEARISFEDGLQCCQGKQEHSGLVPVFSARIAQANTGLASLNIEEAEYAISRGAHEKAAEHLDLAITLTDDSAVREKAESLLKELSLSTDRTVEPEPPQGCSSCSHAPAPVETIAPHSSSDLPAHEYFELLVSQLPEQVQKTYSSLGENFADMYIAASHDNHAEALDKLEKWFDGSHRDIYCYEKGKILHSLGRVVQSETLFRESVAVNQDNPLPHLGLALLLIEQNRLNEALRQLEKMIEGDIFRGQALMLRAEVFQIAGEHDTAINLYSELLSTPLGHAAAEKLYGLLLDCGRQEDAARLFKTYLASKCKH